MPDLVGQTIERYRILEQIGQGGMAVVYRALDTRLERQVAVKVIRLDLVAPAHAERILKRFEREARAMARLAHAGIVSIYDYGKHQGSPYLVMAYIPGGTLRDRLGEPVHYREAARLLAPVGRALAHAHEDGMIHRDVKPGNILLSKKEEPMLTDFGIAKVLGTPETTQLTATGVGVGTPEYMAPEQWRGKALPQTDIYALGVVFYELVTGRRPYTADTPAEVAIVQATEPLPSPRQFVPDLPDVVDAVISRALEKEPEDRYEDMAAFAAALEGLAEEGAADVSAKPELDISVEETYEELDTPLERVVAREVMQPESRATSTGRETLPRSHKEAGEVTAGQVTGEIQPAREIRISLPHVNIWVAGIGFFGLIVVIGLILLANSGVKRQRPLAMLATQTPTTTITQTISSTLMPTITSTPMPTITPTVTNTSTIEFTSTSTFTVLATSAYAVINAREGHGAIIREKPETNSKVLATPLNGTTVEIFEVKQDGNVSWAHVRMIVDGVEIEGWVMRALITIATQEPSG